MVYGFWCGYGIGNWKNANQTPPANLHLLDQQMPHGFPDQGLPVQRRQTLQSPRVSSEPQKMKSSRLGLSGYSIPMLVLLHDLQFYTTNVLKEPAVTLYNTWITIASQSGYNIQIAFTLTTILVSSNARVARDNTLSVWSTSVWAYQRRKKRP